MVRTRATYSQVIKKRGFAYFLLAEFLGNSNDNILRMILILMALREGVEAGGTGGVSSVAVSSVGVVFITPFILFSGLAGRFADTYNKRNVLVGCKVAETLVMTLALVIMPLEHFWLSLSLLFFMEMQAAFFSPSKYGILPEMFEERELGHANGLMGLATYASIMAGIFIGGLLYDFVGKHQFYVALFLFIFSLTGLASMIMMPPSPYPGSKEKLSFNLFDRVVEGSKIIFADNNLIITVAGISWFWFIGAEIQYLLMLIGDVLMHLDGFFIATMLIYVATGISVGSIIAGRYTGEKVSLGLVPIGGFGIGLFSLWFYLTAHSYWESIIPLFLLGASGGIFLVPLNTNLQHLAKKEEKGKLIATSNVFGMGMVILSSFALPYLHDYMHLTSDKIMLLSGLSTIAVTMFGVSLMPLVLRSWLLWFLTHTFFRIHIHGHSLVPKSGSVLLISNQASHMDAFLIKSAILDRNIWFVLPPKVYKIMFLRPFFKLMKVIRSDDNQKKKYNLKEMKKVLENGGILCTFLVDKISDASQALPFQNDLEKIIKDLKVPVITVHIKGRSGKILKSEKGIYFKNLPKRFFYPVTITFEGPIKNKSLKKCSEEMIEK